MNRYLWSSALTVASTLAVLGCGSTDGAGGAGGEASTSATGAATSTSTTTKAVTSTTVGSATVTSSTGMSAAPTVTLDLPSNTVTAGQMVTATVTVTSFVLEAPQNQPNQPGHGHYHIYLDNADGGNYLVANQIPTVTFTIPASTSAGAHTLKISLSDNHHVPLSPPVEDVVDITVQ